MSFLQIIFIGIVLGLTAGISPGPMLTLVITQTIKHNKKEGIKIALTPLITDFPIILVTALLFSKLSEFNIILGIISFVGATFIAFLGYESFSSKGFIISNEEFKSNSLKKGIVTNFLNPHPYLFWATVGAPYIFKAAETNIFSSVIFLFCFYLFLVGSKIMLAILVARSKVLINNKIYNVLMKILGLAMFAFSVLFIIDGLKYLNFL